MRQKWLNKRGNFGRGAANHRARFGKTPHCWIIPQHLQKIRMARRIRLKNGQNPHHPRAPCQCKIKQRAVFVKNQGLNHVMSNAYTGHLANWPARPAQMLTDGCDLHKTQSRVDHLPLRNLKQRPKTTAAWQAAPNLAAKPLYCLGNSPKDHRAPRSKTALQAP